MVFYVFLIGLIIDFGIITTAEVKSTDFIEITEIVLDTNGLGIILSNEIATFASPGSNVFILIGLSQNSVINGIYLAGFGLNGTSLLTFKLGDPMETSTPWFDKGNMSITNYGSIIYFDIIDYVIVFGTPDNARGVVISLPDSFDAVKSNIYPVIDNYKDYLLSSSASSLESNSSSSTTKSDSNTIFGFEGYLVIISLVIPLFLHKYKN